MARIGTGAGTALFVISALLVRLGAAEWDEPLFGFLDGVPNAAEEVLTPLSRASCRRAWRAWS
jgi:hypothetical protein